MHRVMVAGAAVQNVTMPKCQANGRACKHGGANSAVQAKLASRKGEKKKMHSYTRGCRSSGVEHGQENRLVPLSRLYLERKSSVTQQGTAQQPAQSASTQPCTTRESESEREKEKERECMCVVCVYERK
ncbi:uncharacterized protein MONBRDRAFT_28687 [Monosiga brevicollis MX1]|uniref:Uncharacterized protein n=1 Tax=Monosiga brevicollis TaxID=81824 RepID=A9V8W4_MONBE|nr:uncharacterized protein MONBRDRAFT_28687 [Monosiga brevicollis MX1]EDQ86030.1 predicted protein [Monosiga brevicollis MX1]|eukprot:XP_001749224.1 hypothetical protein [Monosiga brevicollis MX1]